MISLLDRHTPWGMRYSAREFADRIVWERHLQPLVLALLPFRVKAAVIVEAACLDNPGNPCERSAIDMLKQLERGRV